MAKYVSEITQFLEDLKERDPAIEAEQKRGRAIWWDRDPVLPDEQKRARESRVAQQAYVYQTKA